MTDEGIRVVRQWLGASNHLEEGECAHMLTSPFVLVTSQCLLTVHNLSKLK